MARAFANRRGGVEDWQDHTLMLTLDTVYFCLRIQINTSF